MNKIKTTLFTFYLLIICNLFLNAQISVTSITPTAAVQNVLIGTGVTASNIQYHGATVAIGKFTSTSTSLPFSSGIILSTGLASGVSGSASAFASTGNNQGSDAQLAALSTSTVKDASVLEFDFIPESDTIRFRYIFASEEYPEFVGTSFNDIFGFFISGINPAGGNYLNKNIALIPNTNTPVTINNINSYTNSTYYVNNSSSSSLIYDGKTVILTAWARVTPCTQYHIKLAIGDISDDIYDSGVFLEANSFTSPRVTITPNFQTTISPGNAIEGCSDAQLNVQLPFTPQMDYWLDFQVTGSATRDVDYTLNPLNYDYIIVPGGSNSTSVNIHPFMDNITEGLESIKFIIKTSICYDIFDTITINIVNRDSLKLNIQGDTLICDGDSATIIASLSDGLQPYQFSWSNGVNSYSQTLLPMDSTQTFIFNATDICNDSETDSIIIKKYIKSISVRSDTAICEGSIVLLYGVGVGGDLVWDNLTGDSVLVNPTTTTQFVASVTNVCGTIKDSVLIHVDEIPYFSLGMDTIVCEQNPIIIGIPSNPDYQYLWSNGLPTSSILTDSPNAYILSVTNGTCSYLDTIVVGAGFCDWWIPNSFSPGKDGINDSFKPVGAPLENYEMVIYDRWGEVIFTTLIWTIGWDGTYLNQNVESGIYFYQIWGNSLGTNEKVLLKFDRVYLYK